MVDYSKVFNNDNSKTGFPTALYTTASHGVLGFGEQIFDLNQNKMQAEINEELYGMIEAIKLGDINLFYMTEADINDVINYVFYNN